MKAIVSGYCTSLLNRINALTRMQLILLILCGSLGIVWPLGGVVLFAVAEATGHKIFGEVALLAVCVTMLCSIAGNFITLFI
jgi:hypothetical protein